MVGSIALVLGHDFVAFYGSVGSVNPGDSEKPIRGPSGGKLVMTDEHLQKAACLLHTIFPSYT